MTSDDISIISIQRMEVESATENKMKDDIQWPLKDVCKALSIRVFGIIAFSVLFSMPWTTIPRSNSIIYQSHWIEILLPCATVSLLLTASIFFELTTWTKEESLMTVCNYLKIYLS